MDTVLWLCPSLPTETLKWLSSLPILMQESFWWWQCSDRYIVSLSPHLHAPFPPFSRSLISLMVSVDVKHHVYLEEMFFEKRRVFNEDLKELTEVECHQLVSYHANSPWYNRHGCLGITKITCLSIETARNVSLSWIYKSPCPRFEPWSTYK